MITEVGSLLEKRRKEIEAGDLETETKKELIAVKSVVDQLQYIQNLSVTLARLCKQY